MNADEHSRYRAAVDAAKRQADRDRRVLVSIAWDGARLRSSSIPRKLAQEAAQGPRARETDLDAPPPRRSGKTPPSGSEPPTQDKFL